jgi:triosephosphate isomerase
MRRVVTLRKPIVIINFKTYAEGTDKKALELAKIAEKINAQTKIFIAVAVQFTDIGLIAKAVNIPVLAQHIDPISYGSHTGHILPEAVKKAGAIGTLINHSERKVSIKVVELAVNKARKIGLTSVVCADTPESTCKVAMLEPDVVAIEPPELIGTGIPVSKAKPEIISKTVKLVRKVNSTIPILCGAGITTGDDVAAALRFGTEGVLIASGIVKAKDPFAVLWNIVQAVNNLES